MAKERKLVLAGGAKPKVRRRRRGEWTEEKKDIFLAELAATCNVSAAHRKAKMSASSVYDLRRRCGEFRARWAEAIREGYARLELELLDRAMNGTVRTIDKGDGRVETIREYPNNVALALLKMHRDGAADTEGGEDEDRMEEVRERIMKKLAIVRARIEAGEA